MPDNGNIIIKGAKVNNLKNVTVEIPRNKFTVVTGISGSGKSSLAFVRGGAAAFCGESVLLCEAVSRQDEQAGRAGYRGDSAGNRDRAEGQYEESALHGGYDH